MAALTGGEMCVKYLMFVFNFIFWIAGTCVMAVGLWLRLDPKTKILFDEEASFIFYTGLYILIGVGALIMVVGFFGCCGAIQESPCLLGLFFFFLLVIFAVEVAAGIWAFSNQTKVTQDVTNFYKATYNKYQETNEDALKETIILIHHGLNCCGPLGNQPETPDQTCPKKEKLDAFITKSCPDAIDEFLNSKLYITGSIGIGIGVIMLFGMIFSMMLCCAIRKTREIV
ncbi:CD9 antigen isoform X1 [Carassius gibelio]|uniref:CD9 antigen isoform X1 n=1 Tax=Carassius gibelio TaxID=101364 RepID=UPI0022791121|nr:CD9 antigen isoform X1 [Carassius gibelio]